MVPITSLWLPILVSSVFVFIISAILHMVIPIHRSDFSKVPSEDAALEALRKFNIPPGDYMFPYCATPGDMKSAEFIEKRTKGPIGVLTIYPSGPPTMTVPLIQWFIFSLVVGTFAAYLTGRALAPGNDYLTVFRFVGTTTFIGYSLALVHDSIWYKRRWSTTIKYLFDGLIYGCVTAGTFGWLWPR